MLSAIPITHISLVLLWCCSAERQHETTRSVYVCALDVGEQERHLLQHTTVNLYVMKGVVR